jgi:hypothetical protein
MKLQSWAKPPPHVSTYRPRRAFENFVKSLLEAVKPYRRERQKTSLSKA